MEKMDFKNKCYQTKDDKLHNTFIAPPIQNVSREQWEEIFGSEEERIVKLRKFQEEKKKEPMSQIPDAPHPSLWDPEWAVLSTGKRMSKRELKEYCKLHNKTWENGI